LPPISLTRTPSTRSTHCCDWRSSLPTIGPI
jgi:hypothetical protein